MVLANMATFPDRADVVEDAVESILPQVDYINVYLNGYNEYPKWTYNDKIYAELGIIGDIQDNGKFYFLNNDPYCIYPKTGHYNLTIDDDLIYPDNYVERMVNKIDEYDRKIAVTCHGKEINPKPYSFLADFKRKYKVLAGFKGDHWVNIAGTGCLGFHTDHINISLKDFGRPGMADLWFSIYCQKHEIPILAMESPAGWIKYNKKMEGKHTLWQEYANNDKYQTQIANQIDWKLCHA